MSLTVIARILQAASVRKAVVAAEVGETVTLATGVKLFGRKGRLAFIPSEE